MKKIIKGFKKLNNIIKISHDMHKHYPDVMSFDEMLTRIKNGASLTRYGDGEFCIMIGHDNGGYQELNDTLSKRLAEVLTRKPNDMLLIGIPSSVHIINRHYLRALFKSSYWDYYWLQYWWTLKKYLVHKNYANVAIFREEGINYLQLKIKEIWDNKTVVFVVPKNGRFFFEKRLFNNIKKRYEIFVPARNAFSQYDEILKQCLKYPKNYLFLVCAGQTATVLTADLFDHGYQAIDIGHLPNCYLECLGEAKDPESYPYVINRSKDDSFK